MNAPPNGRGLLFGALTAGAAALKSSKRRKAFVEASDRGGLRAALFACADALEFS
jgi:hypothetical protein